MKYLIIIMLFLVACTTPQRMVEDVQPLAAPTDKMIVVHSGQTKFREIRDVLDEQDVVFNSDDVGNQTLSIQNDSITLSGGSKVARDIITVDNVATVSGTFPNGTLIQTRDENALYKVQSDSVTGYMVDDTAVINLGANYAVLISDPLKVSYFFGESDTTNIHTEDFQKSIDYAIATGRDLVVDRIFAVDDGIIISGASEQVFEFKEGGRIHQLGPVEGSGTVSGSYPVITITNCNNLVFESPYITGERSTDFILGLGVQCDAFLLTGSTGVESENIRFNNVRINKIIGNGFTSFAHQYFRNVIIDGGKITNCAKTGVNINCENVQVSHVRFEYMRSAAEMSNARNSKFVDNYVKYTTSYGIAFGGDTGSLLGTSYPVDIDGLTIVRKHEGNIVRGNTFWRCGISTNGTTAVAGAIHLAPGAIRSIIAENTIYYTGRDGILIANSQTGNPIVRPLIINNRIVNASMDSSPSQKAGIYTDIPAIIKGNTIEQIDEPGGVFNMSVGIYCTTVGFPVDTTDSPVRDSIYVITDNFIETATGIRFHNNIAQGNAIYERDNIFIGGGLSIIGANSQLVTKVERGDVDIRDSLFLTNYADGPLEVSAGKVVTGAGLTTLYTGDGSLPSDRTVDMNSNMLILSDVNNTTDLTDFQGGIVFRQASAGSDVVGMYRRNDGGALRIQNAGPSGATNNSYFYVGVSSNVASMILNKQDAVSQTNFSFRDNNIELGEIGIFNIGGDNFAIGATNDLFFRQNGNVYGKLYSGGLWGFGGNFTPTEEMHLRKDQGSATRMKVENATASTATAGFESITDGARMIGGTFSSTYAVTRFGNPIASTGELILYTGNGFSLGTAISAPVYLGTNNIEAIEINTGQEVLIGNGSDAGDYKLQVNGNSFVSGESHYGTAIDNGAYDVQTTNGIWSGGAIAHSNASAPSSLTDASSTWSQDVVAGQANLYARGETGNPEQLTGLRVRNTSNFSATSTTTLANVTGLSRNVEAGKVYEFTAILYTTSNNTAGIKAAIAGTATATSIIYEGRTVNSAGAGQVKTRATALATAVGAITNVTVATLTITGTIVVNTAGTLTVQFAQNVSNGTASVVLAGSTFKLIPLSN